MNKAAYNELQTVMYDYGFGCKLEGVQDYIHRFGTEKLQQAEDPALIEVYGNLCEVLLNQEITYPKAVQCILRCLMFTLEENKEPTMNLVRDVLVDMIANTLASYKRLCFHDSEDEILEFLYHQF